MTDAAVAAATPQLPPAAASRRSAHTRQYVLPATVPPPTHLLLYYGYRHLADPAAFADEHVSLCSGLQLSGRVLVASEGINGTLSGSHAAVEAYVAALCAHPLLRLTPDDFKRSAASGAADPFSRECFVLVVDEIVASGGLLSSVPLEATGQGYLTPAAWREALLEARADPAGCGPPAAARVRDNGVSPSPGVRPGTRC